MDKTVGNTSALERSTEKTKPSSEARDLLHTFIKEFSISRALLRQKCANDILENSDPSIKVGVVMLCLEEYEARQKSHKEFEDRRAKTMDDVRANRLTAQEGQKIVSQMAYDFHHGPEDNRFGCAYTILGQLVVSPLPFSHGDFLYMLEFPNNCSGGLSTYQIDLIMNMLEKHIAQRGMTQDLSTRLTKLAAGITPEYPHTSESKKLIRRIKLLNAGADESAAMMDSGEAWSNLALADLQAMSVEEKSTLNKLLKHAHSLASTKPSAKWTKEGDALIKSHGREKIRESILRWFPLIGKRGNTGIGAPRGGGDRDEIISSDNADILKGLAWLCASENDDEVARALGGAAEACFKKVPDVGPRCPKVGNACVAVLSQMSSKEAIAQLSRVKASAKHASAKGQIAKSLENAAERANMTVEDLEEISVPTYEFTEVGRFVKQLGDFRAEIAIAGHNSAELAWFSSDGKQLKSAPTAVKRDFADDVKALKKLSTDIEKLLPSLRYRIESSLLQQRHWDFKSWCERYLHHPICGSFARRLIWNFNGKAGAWSDGSLVDVEGNKLEPIESAIVELWHPIGAQASEVQAWRQWLQGHQITQPFKQAHREIYVLTDAERQTGNYSNRFAAHIIRQHQFAELCKQRGWQYTLQGQWDSANTPTLKLPHWDMTVEFWVEPAGEETSGSFIYLNMSTDQVRFCRLGGRVPVNLTEILPIVFTEVMRDVDLFIGVSSIGNDPTWQDGGNFHDYWHQYSFGDLTATAQTRKEVLSSIIAKLTIGPRCSFQDKFVIVKGDIRTYKIHLGSGNILMEPNDQYLCIVPSQASEKDEPKLFLPFEGDRLLSIILSKCFLLAEDKKIKDPSIVSQINRR